MSKLTRVIVNEMYSQAESVRDELESFSEIAEEWGDPDIARDDRSYTSDDVEDAMRSLHSEMSPLMTMLEKYV